MPRRAKPWYRSATDNWYATVGTQQVPLGVRGRGNEAAAWRAWEALRSGEPPPPTVGPVKAPQAVSVAEVIAAFLDDARPRVAADTFDLYRLFLTPFAELHGRTAAAALTCPVAEAYSRRPNWNGSTRSAFLAVLARAFRHAERARLIDRTPLVGLRRPPIASRAADVLVTADEHARLLAASPPPFRLSLQVLHGTGCRPGEAARLAAADVDWAAGTAVVRKHKTAGKGKRRVLYLTPGVLDLLRPLADRYPTGPLLRNRVGNPWTRATVGVAMRSARRRAGLPAKVAYGYRHTWATDALAAGVSDAVVAELLGHSSTAMLHRHYSHLATRSKVLAEAAQKVR